MSATCSLSVSICSCLIQGSWRWPFTHSAPSSPGCLLVMSLAALRAVTSPTSSYRHCLCVSWGCLQQSASEHLQQERSVAGNRLRTLWSIGTLLIEYVLRVKSPWQSCKIMTSYDSATYLLTISSPDIVTLSPVVALELGCNVWTTKMSEFVDCPLCITDVCV